MVGQHSGLRSAVTSTTLAALALAMLACGMGSVATAPGDAGDAGHPPRADAGPDAGHPADGSTRDAPVTLDTSADRVTDTSRPGRDAAEASPGTDSGTDSGHDARIPTPDTGAEAGPTGPITAAAPCTGTAADVYAAVSGLPPMTDALRGDIVACTSDGTLDVATVQGQLTAKPDPGVTATSGVAIYRVQYRTTRSTGADGYSSARIYLPLAPMSSSPPVIVAAHGTGGLAASCATSMSATSMQDLALPWAALGYAVIAPDYAGLGTPGTQGYEDNRDTARSVVDSVEALRKFVSRTLGQKVVIDGHSQGAGAALATQALAKSMNLDGDLVAVVAFAPEYFSHMDSLGYVGALESVAPSNPLTIFTGVTKCTVAVMLEYAYFANHVTAGLPTAGFPPAKASGLGGAVTSQCTIALGGAVQFNAPHVSDWTDPTLRNELLDCIAMGDAGLGPEGGTCTAQGQAFYQYLKQNILPPDPNGAAVLLVQGLQDIVMPPAEEAACNVAVLEAGGVTPQVCTDATASHTNVTQNNIAFGISWAQAVLAGTTLPPCAASALPACSAP